MHDLVLVTPRAEIVWIQRVEAVFRQNNIIVHLYYADDVAMVRHVDEREVGHLVVGAGDIEKPRDGH